jgi:tRNA modification GTPase
MIKNDTIVAPATPPGRGGIGVIRLSGPQAVEIAAKVLRPPKLPLETQRATVVAFPDPEDGRMLDEVVVTCFRRPRSYTGEDVAEISCHGSPVILGYLVQCCLARGARAAEPGEFTLRAFLNGRMDLSQAEAVRDLIESRTLYQARVAALQLGGSLSARIKPYRQSLLDLIAMLEAGIDFGEDDVPVMPWEEIFWRLDGIYKDLAKLAESYRYGRMIREGLTLALAGRPNVGKSSVFNRLLNMERAIVTPVPGTTRDLVSETATLDGIPLQFVDTAGIRKTQDEIEKIGIERTHQAIADADLRLLIVDASDGWCQEDSELLRQTCRLGRMLLVANKCDLPMRTNRPFIEEAVQAAGSEAMGGVPIVFTSAKTGEGFEELKTQIIASVGPGQSSGIEAEWLTNARHQQVIAGSLEALARARQAAEQRVHHEMLLLDLYEALRRLDELTGTADVESILQVIFSKFCIGK